MSEIQDCNSSEAQIVECTFKFYTYSGHHKAYYVIQYLYNKYLYIFIVTEKYVRPTYLTVNINI